MNKYIKVLFEPFFDAKWTYIFQIFVNIVLLAIWLGSVELIRRLILAIEQNLWLEVSLQYGIFAVLLILLVFVWRLYFSYMRPQNFTKMQNYLYAKYLNNYVLLDNEKVNNYGNGKFINIIISWTVASAEILYIILIDLWVSVIWYILNISMIAYINPYLVLPVIILTALLLFSMTFTSNRTFDSRKERKVLWEKQSKQVLKILMEKFTILKNGKKEEEIKKVITVWEEIADKWKQVSFYMRLFEDGAQSIIDTWEIILVLIIWYFIYQNTSSFADMWALLFIMALIKKNISTISIYYKNINNLQNNFTRIVDIFEEIEPIKNYETWKKYKYIDWSISIKELSYKYPDGKSVFNKINLEIPAKSKTAFIWKSWSWKSTMVKLILGFIEKQRWSILIDKQDLSEISLKSYYPHVWYLQQDTSVFDGTLLENITYGVRKKFNKKDIDNVIKLSACEFIYDLPKWINTEVWEKWVKLSWWERQRVAIARLILENPDIIILDEPTSALDSFSEDSIQKALKNLTKRKTVITIAHRLQTIRSSDIIFIFDNGKIIDSGNHKYLLESSNTYKKLIDLQSWGVY